MSYYPTLDRLTIIVLRAANLKKMEPHGTGDDTSFICGYGKQFMRIP